MPPWWRLHCGIHRNTNTISGDIICVVRPLLHLLAKFMPEQTRLYLFGVEMPKWERKHAWIVIEQLEANRKQSNCRSRVSSNEHCKLKNKSSWGQLKNLTGSNAAANQTPHTNARCNTIILCPEPTKHNFKKQKTSAK